MTEHTKPFEGLLNAAQAGDEEAFDLLLARCRDYLKVRSDRLSFARDKAEQSDLVQQTLFEAFRDFDDFAGHTDRELLAWLRQILAHNLADREKTAGRAKRSAVRTKSVDDLDSLARVPHKTGFEEGSTPSAHCIRQERATILMRAISQLPDDYRQVVQLRQFEGLEFREVALRMGRSSCAVRQLWVRALDRLHVELGPEP